jgi:poly(A) polymerase
MSLRDAMNPQAELPSLAREKWLRARALQKLFRVITAAGGEARVAGGAVRNALMGLPVSEVDVATTLEPNQVMEACAAAGMGVHPTGLDHGTVTVVSQNHPYEVTTLRHDVETFGRHARVAFTGDWEADAARRDFTMNALYCDAEGRVCDFTGGYRDILAKRVVFVGEAEQRIREDYLRILRFFRFHARFGDGAPDGDGLSACARLAAGIDALSAERIRQEMLKLLEAAGAVPTLQLMAASGILGHCLPYTEDWRVIGRLPQDGILRLAALAQDPLAMKTRWRLSNEEGRRLENLAEFMPPSPALRPREQRIVLYQTGAETWRDLVRLAWARSDAAMDDPAWKRLLRLPDRWTCPKFPVAGRDLIAGGLNPGPEIGVTLRRLEDWWVASDFTATKDELLAKAK